LNRFYPSQFTARRFSAFGILGPDIKSSGEGSRPDDPLGNLTVQVPPAFDVAP
jgi:hypothetical protein